MSNVKYYIWSAINRFGTELLGFVGNVLIARALMPEDYGLVAMLAIFTAISMTFTDSGFNDCLIRKSNSDKKDFGTIATYNVVVALLFYLVIYFCAPYIAQYFGQPELINLSRVLCFSIVLKAFSLSGFVQLTKNLRFKTSAIIHLLCSLLSIIIIYSLALLGFGYWALGLQPIVIALLNIILLLLVARWRPYFCFHWDRFKEMFAYSSNLLVSYFVNVIGANIYSFIIGKFYSVDSLGYYNQAHKMQGVPTEGINSIILTTSYPIIAKEQDAEKRYALYVNLFKQFNFIITFIVFALISIADVVFWLLFGEKWLPSSYLFQIFMLLSLVVPMKSINVNIVKILGRSDIYRNLAFLRSGLQILALCITAPFSLKIIIIGQVIAAFFSVSIDMFFCGRTIDFTFFKQYSIWFSIFWKPLLAFILSNFVVFFIKDLFWSSAVEFMLYVLLFFVICIITKDKNYRYYKNLIRRMITSV